MRRAAGILAALADVGVTARAARAHDLVLHLLLERRCARSANVWMSRRARRLAMLLARTCRAAEQARTPACSATVGRRRRLGRQSARRRTRYARSGSSAMPVPSAMTPNPIQIQLTSGLTTISSAAPTDRRALGRRRHARHRGPRRACGGSRLPSSAPARACGTATSRDTACRSACRR